ncbi:Acetolactate synthase, small subunit [Shewanella piezotolerans WP3]|uniref:Acetolactate synthase, small subunit n=1 Tax=Shewanella piezotolerans (strain WP3 / JCM 13877) TaxID=225849 RepID=B8CHR8_SHEPW|nr:acetolactate synthase 2 small subunit [Shewanella piezotolerans]ACJ27194.1 Acetolactate synthase, small subunit [Shewanella piezotolerans WP3]
MSNYAIAINVQQRPEVLERVLRVVRHRGFNITNLAMQLNDNNTSSIDMSLQSDRAIELLTNQINKLIDVLDCQVLVVQSNMTTESAKG